MSFGDQENPENSVGDEEKAFDAVSEPLALFDDWFAQAQKSELNDPNAVAVGTVDEHGMPNVRMVLLKGHDARGFVFYTNFESQKGREILASGKAAMCFHWKSLRKQVRLRGAVRPVEDAEADAYFASRHRDSRIGAWASKQSRPLESRFAFEKEIAKAVARFNVGDVPRPPHWSGFRLVPESMEFWADRNFRLHDRVVFKRDAEGVWGKTRLYP